MIPFGGGRTWPGVRRKIRSGGTAARGDYFLVNQLRILAIKRLMQRRYFWVLTERGDSSPAGGACAINYGVAG
jgi:hypothetical protein